MKSASGVMAVRSRPRLQPGRAYHDQRRCAVRRSRQRQESAGADGASRQVARSRRHELSGSCAPMDAAGGKRVLQRDEPDDWRRAGEGRIDTAARNLQRSWPTPGPRVTCRRTTSRPWWATAIISRPSRLKVVPNGFWPLDFGGALGEPVTRGILSQAARGGAGWTILPRPALRAAGLKGAEASMRAKCFTRK